MNKGWKGMGEIHPGMNFLRSDCFKMHGAQNLVSGTCSFVHTLILLLTHSSIQQKVNVCWRPCTMLAARNGGTKKHHPYNQELTVWCEETGHGYIEVQYQ